MHVGGEATSDGDGGALLYEVANVVVLNVDVFRLQGAWSCRHWRCICSSRCLRRYLDSCRAFDGASKGREELAEEQSLLGGGGEGHVFGLRNEEGERRYMC